jgi:hypothetical protein
MAAMEANDLEVRARLFNELKEALRKEEESVVADATEHQLCVTAFEDNRNRLTNSAVHSSERKKRETKRRFDAAFQAMSKFKNANAGHMAEIEAKAEEMAG